jgi:hypothetical protein
MEAFGDLWKDQLWWVIFVISALIGLAGATGVLDRGEEQILHR